MPRLAPDGCQEVRITLGSYERTQLRKFQDSYRIDKIAENIPNVMLGVAGLTAGAGIAVLGYGVYKWAGGLDLFDDIKAGWDRFRNIPSAINTWYRWRFRGEWPSEEVPPPEYHHDYERTEPHYEQHETPEGEQPSPWSVMGLTYEQWLAEGAAMGLPEGAGPVATWTDWILHHEGQTEWGVY